MSHEVLNDHINELIHKRDQVLSTVNPEIAVYLIDYYENAINLLIDRLVDLECAIL